MQAKIVRYHLIIKDQNFLLLIQKVLGGKPSLQLAVNGTLHYTMSTIIILCNKIVYLPVYMYRDGSAKVYSHVNKT